MRVVYTSWDGSQEVELDPRRLFQELARHMAEAEDFTEALDRLLREGVDEEGMEVVGLDELLSRVRDAIDDILGRYNLDEALEGPERRLREAVEMEEQAQPDSDAGRRSRAALDRLPRPLDEALDRLRHWNFEDEDATLDPRCGAQLCGYR